MADIEPEDEDRSLIETFRWLFFGQFDDSTEDTLRQGFIFIGLATSFLAFVGATSAFLQSAQLYWVTLALGVLGVVTLVFTWMLVQNQLEGLFDSGPEPEIANEPSDPDDSVGADSEESVPGDSDVDA